MAFPRVVPLNWRDVPELPTSFCFCPIKDVQISSQLLLLMVLNKAESTGSNDGQKNTGKRQGFGMPGGGVNPECLDSIDGAAKRETESETGLSMLGGYRYSAPVLEEYQLIVSAKQTGERKKRIPYEKGKEPPISIDIKNEIAIRNPVYTFRGEVSWEKSILRQLFLKVKSDWLSSDSNDREVVGQSIEQNGMYVLFEDLSEEEVQSLRIEEIDEIAGIGVFTLSFLLQMLEERNPYFEDNYFYYNHLSRIKSCATKLKLV